MYSGYGRRYVPVGKIVILYIDSCRWNRSLKEEKFISSRISCAVVVHNGGEVVNRQITREQLEHLEVQMKHLLLAKGHWGLIHDSEAFEDKASAERI